jgi:nucleoside 2-deoxyribosyltransferase
MINHKSDIDIREKASHIAAERHLRNKNSFIICEQDSGIVEIYGEHYSCFTMETFLKNYPKDSIEILDRTLLNLAQLEKFPGDIITLSSIKNNRGYVEDQQYPKQSIAFTNYWNKSVNVLLLLHIDGLIFLQTNSQDISIIEQVWSERDHIELRISPKGWQRIRELQKKQVTESQQAFVAMWFDESRNEFFASMEQAVKDAGFEKCVRIDNIEHNNKICDEILAEIRKSRFVIADFTGNRGGIYFEAGFALGLDLPVIWLVDKKGVDDLHFDTRQYSHIVYENKDDLYKKLKARIEATIFVN